ncbi:MAG: hypothetical protein WBL45_12300 [Solirubrobacterales bacterium]
MTSIVLAEFDLGSHQMIRRRAVVGLSLLSALLFSAFVVQSASAIERTTSNNTTAVTCVPDAGKTGDFKDAHCLETATGDGAFKHEVIALNTTTEAAATNAGATESTKKSEPAVLKASIGLAKVTIECTVAKNITKNSTVHNVEPVSKQHTFTGVGESEFTTCNVKEMAKCVVAEPIVTKATIHGVEKMVGPNKGESNAMGVEYVGSGPEETFAEIEFKNKGAEACAQNGKKYPIKGNVIATSGPTTESGQENKASGVPLVFTPKFNMQTLKLGPNPATFETIITSTMAGGGSPISLTTTT